jgi:hypothetical protein
MRPQGIARNPSGCKKTNQYSKLRFKKPNTVLVNFISLHFNAVRIKQLSRLEGQSSRRHGEGVRRTPRSGPTLTWCTHVWVCCKLNALETVSFEICGRVVASQARGCSSCPCSAAG